MFVSFVLCFRFFGTCLGHAWDIFGHTFGTLLEHYFEQIEISKSNDILLDHFSIKNKASHKVERQIQRFLFSLYFLSERCCLLMSVNRIC